LLTDRFKPEAAWKVPLRLCGKRYQRIPNTVFQYPNLSYSVVKDGIFCAPCSIFVTPSTPSAFVKEPYSDWSNIDRIAQRHMKSEAHI